MATQTVSDLGRATGWVAAAALSSSLVVTSPWPDQEPPRPRRIERSEYFIALTAREVAFDVVALESGSVFGATADATLSATPHAAGQPAMDDADDEPLFVDVAAPTIRVRARVRSVDRSTAYEGTAFDHGDDDDAD